MDIVKANKFKLDLLIQKLSDLITMYLDKGILNGSVDNQDLINLKEKLNEYFAKYPQN
jgi:hypothetical protein